MATPPKSPNKDTTPQQRTDQLRQALTEREAGKTIRSAQPAKQAEGEPSKALDTFEAAAVPAAAVALKGRDLEASATVGDEITGRKEVGEDEENLAGRVGDPLEDDDEPDRQSLLDGKQDDEDDDEDSSFNFTNPGREKIAEMAGDLFGDADQHDGQDGDARGGGRGEIGSGIAGAAEFGEAKGYTEEQSSLDEGEMAAVISGDFAGLLGARNSALTEELDVMTGLLGDLANSTTSKTSVASGEGTDTLSRVMREVYGEPAKDPDAGKSTNVELVSKGQAGLPGGNAAYWDNEKGEVVFADQVTEGGKNEAAKGMTTTRQFNQNDSKAVEGDDAKSGFDLGSSLGIALADWLNSDEDAAADKASAEAKARREAADEKRAEDEAKRNDEAAKKKAEEKAEEERKADEARKKQEEEEAKEDGGGAKQSGDPDDPDGDLGGPPTEAELAFRQHLRNATGYKGAGAGQQGGEVDPADDATGAAVSASPTGLAAMDKADLIGQPNDPDLQMGGGAAAGGPGNLPGDQGNIDPGEENDTGAFTSEQRGGNPGDIDTGVGGAPLARPNDSGNDDEGEEVVSRSVLRSLIFRADDDTRDVRDAARSALADDDDD